ncbi:acetylornithine deacetylase [Nocardioides albertanoniae]|uniref:Acetylornithine deacetylase n=1 Tax=Nocardioides albertanoniae TaxID=1175486 RepID=A0A543A275_9ACTN|nr:M20 family metallopeptidase [Nocardioides albertanoniae]TQL66695.1 acetylornithine deacetylase [Nocardioides albertanoniae]
MNGRQVDADDVIRLAQRLVRARGQNPPGEEAATVAVLVEECCRRGFEVTLDEVAPGRENLIARIGSGSGPGLLVVSHSDVVPPGDGWRGDPFSGDVRDGRLHGRGSADTKGGLAAAIVALSTVDNLADGPITLAVLVDEEELGLGVRHFVDGLSPADYAACLVIEPTSLQPVVAARGDAYLEITIEGRAAHSGNPADGRNAIHGMAQVVAEIERWHDELAAAPHPLCGPATWSVGTIEGGQATSTVAARCRITADRRLLPSESAGDVHKEVVRRLGSLGLADRGLGVEVAMTMDMPGFETSVDDPIVHNVAAALTAAGVPSPEPTGWTAACDGGFVASKGIPVVVLGPGSVAEQAHRPDESVELRELLAAAQVYAELIAGHVRECRA